MHLYNAEMANRPRVIATMAGVATSVSVAIGVVFEHLPSAGGPPSATLIFGGMLYWYDRFAWRWLSAIPNVAGSWTGSVTIKTEGQPSIELACLVNIKQHWLRMSIVLYTIHTRSTSLSALFHETGSPLCEWRYEYRVERREGYGIPGMAAHDGVARLDFQDRDTCVGNFFNDQNYQHAGRYDMTRAPGPIKAADWLAQQDDLPRASAS